jgi:hypothetical protein
MVELGEWGVLEFKKYRGPKHSGSVKVKFYHRPKRTVEDLGLILQTHGSWADVHILTRLRPCWNAGRWRGLPSVRQDLGSVPLGAKDPRSP